jgi:hypothetical protein
LRLGLLGLALLLVSVTRGFWTVRIGHSLVCPEQALRRSDAIVVENFDPNYLVFERAAALHTAGWAPRVFVPVQASRDPARPSAVSKGIAELMARVAHLKAWEMIPIQESEPISLHAALQVRDVFTKAGFTSVIIVTPGFRSRRSSLIYQTVLTPVGITVSCVPVFGQKTPQNWTTTWHGIQEVTEQFLKLQFYRFYVLWRLG